MKQITHDTLMSLADAYANGKAHTTSRFDRAALSTALSELMAERDEHKENAILNARSAVSFKTDRDALEVRLGAMMVERSESFFKVIQERDANALDATRYQFLRMRLKVSKMAAVSGSVRDGIEVKVGCSFLDSKLPHTIPESYPIEQAEKLDAAIDAAMKDTP